MSKKLAVLGGGPGGYVATVRAAQMGAEVTQVEKDTLGDALGPAKELAETIHAHPTLAEVTLEAAFKTVDRALHG